jgi:hypothetical protein
MSKVCKFSVGRCCVVLTGAAWICCAQLVVGQGTGWNSVPNGLIPMLTTEPQTNSASPAAYQQPAAIARRGPIARLVANPDQTDGAPPFALTDQSGTIQRYVEPVPGVDLRSYVGQVVVVRHDTGGTLLASQLELPQQPLRPLAMDANDDRYASAGSDVASGRRIPNLRRLDSASGEIEQVQYAVNDDSSVQLLPDDLPMSNGNPAALSALMPLEGMGPGGGDPMYANQMGPPVMNGPPCGPAYGRGYGPGYGPQYAPMQYGSNGMPGYPQQMIGPCPNCGDNRNGMGYGTDGAYPAGSNVSQSTRPHFSADVELMLLRPQIAETAIGKLSEEYQFSPRFILGAQGVGNLDARVRYWHYDRTTDLLGTPDDIRLKFDVLDVEAVHRFAARRSELTLAAGVRLAGIHLTDIADFQSDADLIGITMAGDGLTPLGYFPGGHLGLVYGGRLSILGGNWRGDDSQFVDGQQRNDNVLVHELYGGVEIARRVRAIDLHARLVFEMQNWKSDVLADRDFESIGFFGPGLELGADF